MSESMTPQWFKEHQIKAHIDTGLFPDNCAAGLFPEALLPKHLRQAPPSYHVIPLEARNCFQLYRRTIFLRRYQMSLIVFWGRLGLPIPRRVPLLTVIGKPIPCPKMPSPSPELMNAYHEKYLQATRDIYETYRNTMGHNFSSNNNGLLNPDGTRLLKQGD
eukprot:gene31572-40998_t